ncbi:hypothetical protein [Achromobacter dolens]|uniref:hypothetical protein n=1 Tax=Achromobacter dolens TaxID=1287738 RepID=UPI001F07FAA6|nr:hypothetical protein [Achromobacter dolens]
MNAPAEQRTEEWRQERAGKITASNFAAAIAVTPGDGVYKTGPRKGQPKVAKKKDHEKTTVLHLMRAAAIRHRHVACNQCVLHQHNL